MNFTLNSPISLGLDETRLSIFSWVLGYREE